MMDADAPTTGVDATWPPPPEDFHAALLGDGRPLILLTALALVISGGFAVFLAITGQFLPHDVAYLGLSPAELCRPFDCRIVAFMMHDRLAFGGVLLAIGTLYAWLALYPLGAGEAWAWWTLALSGVAGFGSFLTYLSYGYLDTWHGMATLLLLPVFLEGLHRSHALVREWPSLRTLLAPSPGWAATRGWAWFGRAGLGRLCLILTGVGMLGAGGTILAVGTTRVFVPEDLDFIGATVQQLRAISPRLIPLIAHDRAGFGGGLATTGLVVVCIVWKADPRRHVWQALLAGGVFGFGSAIGVHYSIDYLELSHLGPAWVGALVFAAGMWLSRGAYRVGGAARTG